jgi:hypothetical protein
LANSFTFFPELFKAGYVDELQKRVRLFNESTDGAITLQAQDAEGVLVRDKFFKRPSNLVSRATRGDKSDAATVDLNEDEIKRAQIDALVGPVELGQLEQLAAGRTPEAFSEAFGQMAAEQVFEEYAESLFNGIVGALASESSLVYEYTDGSGNLKNAEPQAFNKGMGQFGDQRRDLALMIMDSSVETNLIDYGITSGDDPTVERGAISGTPATVGLPYIPADLDALETTNGHYTAIIRQGGAGVQEVDQPEIEMSDTLFKNEGITQKMGADFRFNIRVQGFSFDDTVSNPSHADLADSSNWTLKMSDATAGAGVLVETL